jgi:CheY-like chemotaxis protein
VTVGAGARAGGPIMHSVSRVTRKPTVLLIDDSAADRNLYELALEHEFRVLTAARGSEGASLARQSHPDAIVLDVIMPGMDGWETCTFIKSDRVTADIPVILLTGADDRDLSQHATAVGADALLRKPCPLDELRETIVTAMKTRRMN